MTDPDGNPVANGTVRAMYKGGSLPSFIPGFESSGYFGFATTDADGRYVIADLAPTVFTIDFSPVDSSAGPPPPTPYLEEWYLDSRSEAGATPIELSEGVDTVLDAQLELGATISGRVTDPAGNPVAGVTVSSPANIPFGGPLTDADGRYTLTGVPPGDLAYVAAFPEDPRFLPGFYGGANFDTAAHLQVGLGQVIEGIDIQLATPGIVNVAVFRPDGSTAPSVIVPCIAPGMPVVVPHPAPGFGPLIQCSSGGQVNVAFSPAGGFRIPVGTYNAISAEGIGGFGVTTLNPSDVATFTLTADTPIDCTFHLGGTASCAASEPATNDGDGVPASVEDEAPNSGDGNDDGVRDAEQSNVTSLPAAVGGGFVTLVVAVGLHITAAHISSQPAVTQPFETGAIGVTFDGVAVGGTADVTILRTAPGAATEVWSLNHETLQYSAVPADFTSSTIVAHIVDGGVFDNQNQIGPFYNPPDGAISAYLTPVIPRDTTPPTITCPTPPSFLLNRPAATLSASVSDSGSGVAIDLVKVAVPTNKVGANTVAVTASDRAGNINAVSCSYSIGVRFYNIGWPRASHTTIVKAGRVVPVTWRAVDFFGRGVSDPAHFLGVSATASSCVKGSHGELGSVRNRGLRYLGNGRWEFDWTTPITKGCYTAQLSLTGVSKTAHIKVK